MDAKGFESKVMELVAVTQRLDVPRILLVRRMTMSDPETLKWASVRQLDLIFNVILEKALERTGHETVQAASHEQFDPLLPPGDETARDQERWMLFDLAKPMLAGMKPAEETTTQAVMEELAADEAPIEASDFATLFDETLVRHTRRVLQALACTGARPHIPHPFVVAPTFAAVYEQVLREYVLKPIRSTRRIKEMASSRNWQAKGSAERLLGMVLAGEDNNPILHFWDQRWQGFDPARATAKGKGAIRPEDNPWGVFKDDGTKHEYLPPFYTDIPMLQRIIRFDGEELAEQWEQITQIYQQEFNPKSKSDQARQGAFRDALLRALDKIENHGGDLLVIRAFYDLPKVDRMFLKMLIQSLGRSDKERDRRAPLLITFYNDLPR
ncbi:MAG TPA: hypothetical protein VL974_04360 [Magnetospirillum sp.]|jgi:hypothetical protein|nr:hypothetical protein [Magnetospirillum sp.]